MDEQTKAQLRREFTSRFRRAAIGIPIVCAALLTMWLLDSRHGNYLWLTVLPLVFLVPLHRYHAAIRLLTEPENTIPDSERALTEMRAIGAIRDAAGLAKIRSQANIRSIAMSVFLVLLAFVWFKGIGDVAEITSTTDRRLDLIANSQLIEHEFLRFWAERGEEMAVYSPPANPAALQAWAKQVQQHFGYPAAVFLLENSHVRWVTEPADAEVEARTQEDCDTLETLHQPPVRDYGPVRVYMLPKRIKVDGHDYGVWLAKPTDGSAAWGAISSVDDEWTEFFHALDTAPGERLALTGPAWALNSTFVLPTSNLPEYRIGLRATRSDTVIFKSPDLKVTADSIHFSTDQGTPISIEYYAAQKGFGSSIQKVIWTVIRWGFNVLAFAMLIVTLRWHFVVRRLTEPE